MADRRRQIELLIATRYDLLWFPGGSLRTQAGLAPGARRQCPTCSGDGTTLDRFKRLQPCATCGGSRTKKGRVKAGKGWVYVDRMDADRTPIAAVDHHDVATRPSKTVLCDACGGSGVGVPHLRDPENPSSEYRDACPRCNGSGRRTVAVFDLQLEQERSDVDALTASIDRRDKAGSYAELEAALRGIYAHMNKPLTFTALTANARQALRLLDEIYLPPVTREIESLDQFEDALLELALAYIDSRMPDPIRVPAGVSANARTIAQHRTKVRGRGAGPRATDQRNKEIRRLARQRKPVQWIAAEYGLSVSTVYAIVSGERDAVA